MTEQARRQQINQSLEQHHAGSGEKETLVVPLSRGAKVLPVITVPLAVPVLNTKSFRIAPDLEDHPSAELVRTDPGNPEVQRIVSNLVRESHKFAVELKESLKDGQDDPGLITRSGILINANTRCVLMRELVAEGEVSADAIRVAVLPSDISEAELLDLEAVIQKQRPHKDEYNLVSELMMLKRLSQDAQMSPEQISKRQRLNGPKDVLTRLAVLTLMEHARHLVTPPLSLTTFGGKRSKLQNWKEVLLRYEDLQSRDGLAAADRYLSEWLFASVLGIDSVHRLRYATDGWVNRHVSGLLQGEGDIGDRLVVTAAPTAPLPIVEQLDGLDLLGVEAQPQEAQGVLSPNALLQLAVAATKAGPTGTVKLADGTEHSAEEISRVLKTVADKGLRNSKRQVEAGDRLVAPENLLKKAADDFSAAIKALDDVVNIDEFDEKIDGVRSLLGEISAQIEEATDLLESRERLN